MLTHSVKSAVRQLSIVSYCLMASVFMAGCGIDDFNFAMQANREITITSEPPGGTVTVNGSYLGETPLKVKVKQMADRLTDDWVFVVTKPGFKDATKEIHFTGWSAEGAAARLIPDTLSFSLEPVAPIVARSLPAGSADPQSRDLQKQLDELRRNQVNNAELGRKQKELEAKLKEIEARRQAPATAPATSGIVARWAVLVGISKYKHEDPANGFSNLAYADADAEAMKDALLKRGWQEDHICLLTNEQATKQRLEIALESWLSKAGPDDLIVLFWSGHAFPDPVDSQKVYFVCHDTQMMLPVTGFRMDRVKMILEERHARNVVVLADSCHAGRIATRGNERAIGIEPYVRQLKEQKATPKGWVFMTGADTNRKAIEHSSWSHGAFTKCLLDTLGKRSDKPVTLGDLRTYLNEEMPEITQKVLGEAKRPYFATDAADSDIWNVSLDAVGR